MLCLYVFIASCELIDKNLFRQYSYEIINLIVALKSYWRQHVEAFRIEVFPLLGV